MNPSTRPFGLRDKWGYLFGDFGNDFTFLFASIFLTVFYTKVLGIPTEVTGLLFLLARAIDGVTDLTMGRIADRSPAGKNGRFRPWILRMCLPVCIASFLMYQHWMANASLGLRVVYMFVTYILWGSILYTSINIPYGSMASVLSPDPNDRASLSTYRSLGASLAGLIVGAGAPLLLYSTDANGNQVVSGSRFTLVAGLFSLAALVCYLLCYYLTTERVQVSPPPRHKQDFSNAVKQTLKSRPMLGLIVAAVLMLLAALMTQTVQQFLFVDYFRNSLGLSLMSGASILPVLVLAPAAVPLSRRFGKREISALGCIVGGAGSLLLYALQTRSMGVFIAVSLLSGVGYGFFNMLVWAFLSDVIDHQQLRTGTRDDGTIYGIYSFARKLGQALAGGLGGLLLGTIGYDEGVQIQTESVRRGLYTLSTLVPGVLYILVGLCLLLIYPLGKRQVEENQRALQARNNENPSP